MPLDTPEPVMLPSLPPVSPSARPAPFTPERTNRLTYDDEVFLRSATVLDVPVVGQNCWRFPGEIPVERVQAFVDRIAQGPVNRLVVRPKVPGARSRFVPATVAEPVRVHPDRIKPEEVMDWLDTTLELRFDPEKGPLWAIFMAYTTDGQTMVAFNISHIIGDGTLKLGATIAAVRGIDLPRLPFDDEPTATQVSRADDWRDAGHMVGEAFRGLRKARQQGPLPKLGAQTAEGRPVPEPLPDDDVVHDVPFVGADCPVAEWDDAVRRAGGTTNTLFIALTVEMLLAAGIVEAGKPVKTSIPVSMRGVGDLRSNATSGVSIAVDTEVRDGVGRVKDLAHIRERSKKEFKSLFDGTRPNPDAALAPIMQMIPDGLARRLAGGITSPLCLASNLGKPDPDFLGPFGVQAEAVLYRGIAQGATRGQLRRMRGGVTTWCGETDGVLTFSIRALDPDAVPDVDTLRRLVAEVYSRWGLTPTFW